MYCYYLVECCNADQFMIPGKLRFNTLDEMLDYILKHNGEIVDNMVTFKKKLPQFSCRTFLIQETLILNATLKQVVKGDKQQ